MFEPSGVGKVARRQATTKVGLASADQVGRDMLVDEVSMATLLASCSPPER